MSLEGGLWITSASIYRIIYSDVQHVHCAACAVFKHNSNKFIDTRNSTITNQINPLMTGSHQADRGNLHCDRRIDPRLIALQTSAPFNQLALHKLSYFNRLYALSLRNEGKIRSQKMSFC